MRRVTRRHPGGSRATRRSARASDLGFALGAVLGLAAAAGPARAANATTAGELQAYATYVSAGFEWRITGDDNNNCAVTLEFRRAGLSAWHAAQPLLRVEHGLWTHGEDPGNLLAGSLFFLQPGTAYEARLTLADPDGGAAQRVVAFTTRVPPQASAKRTLYVAPGSGGGTGAPGDPLRGLAAADAVARPGDLFLLAAGTYHGNFRVTRDGTASDPIAYRGVDGAGVTLDGDGGTASTSHCIDLTNRQHVLIERMSLVNVLRPLCADSAVDVVVRGCTVRPVNLLVGTEGITAAASRDLLIEDNAVLMPGQWATIGRTGAYGTGGYGILIEGTGHVIRRNTVVEAWDAISIPVTATAVPFVTTSNVDVYGNDVDRASDDGVQADAIQHNVRVFRNRLLNTGSAVSFQPAFGGPGYVLYNEVFNNRIEPWKMHQETSYGWTQETSGFVFAHNTSVCSRNAWYESGIWRNGRFRDNLFVGARPNTYSLYMPNTYVLASFDADGYNRVDGFSSLVRFSGSTYANLPAFHAATGHEEHGLEVSGGDFRSLVLPHDPQWNPADGYGWAYAPGDYDLRLSAASVAADAAVPLANVDDDFHGAAPDLGCYERGAPARAYGARTANRPPVAAAFADSLAGTAPLSVRFRSEADDVDGLVVARRWDFGDGAAADDERAPTHTYAAPGRWLATFTATDEDGATASATLTIDVRPPLAVGGSGQAAPVLSPAAPNPFSDRTRFSFTLPAAAEARLTVYDVRGALVRTLAAGPQPAGTQALEWDGRDDAGRPMPPGLYLCRLSAGPTALVRRVLRMR